MTQRGGDDNPPAVPGGGPQDDDPAPAQGENDKPTVSFTTASDDPAAARARADALPAIDGYEITSKLSDRGGQGTVWRAIQLGTRRPVALKFLRAGLFSTPRARARFEREIELMASLEHPNIATVFEGGPHRGVYFYAMELIDGVDLKEFVQTTDLGREEILRLLAVICRAVQHAHQRGIIHRDLKPSNVMVTRAGEPRVVDFGLAKPVGADEARGEVSLEGTITGSYPYMSPEQAAGKGDLDTRTDVYSLGVILYELLTGRLPRDMSGGHLAVLNRIASGEIDRPSEVCRQIDGELEAVLLKALAHDRDARYASAGALADDIDNYLAGEPLAARRPTTWYFLGKRLRKHRLRVAGVVLALLASVAGVVFYVVSINAAHDDTKRALRKAKAAEDTAELRALRAHSQRALSLDVLNRLVFEVQRRLSRGLGQTRLRKDLLDVAMAGLRKVAAAAEDPLLGVDRSLAVATVQIGDVFHQAGQSDEAVAAYERALVAFEALAASDANDPVRLHDLCVAHMRLGQLLLERDELAPAGSHLASALAAIDKIESRHAVGDDLRRDRWTLLISLGDLKLRTGDARAAKDSFQQALALVDRPVPAAASAPARGDDLARTLKRLGDAYLQLDDPDTARGRYVRALAIDRVAADADPNSPAAQRDLAVSLAKMAETELRRRRTAEARRYCLRARAIQDKLLQANTDSLRQHVNLAANVFLLGEIDRADGNPAGAGGHYRRAAEILRRLQREGKLKGVRRFVELLERVERALGQPASRGPAPAN